MPLVDALAIEVLSEITGYLDASEISTLYAVGSRNLSIKLARDGTDLLALSWTQSGWIPWPKSLFERHTSIRKLSWTSGNVSTLCKAADLTYLSPKLESLTLDFLDSFFLIERTDTPLCHLFPALHTIRLRGASVNEAVLLKVPNTVTHLEVTSTGSTLDSSRFLASLPDHLKILKLDFGIRAEPPSHMPRYIETLELRITSSSDWAHILPANLTHLRISANADAIQFKQLPTTLTKVIAEWPLELNASALASLPPNLKILHCWFDENPSERLIASMPESLKEIRSFSGCGSLQRRKFDNSLIVSNQSSTRSPSIVMCMPEAEAEGRTCDCSSELGNPFSPFLTLLVVTHLDCTIASWLPPTLTELRFQDGYLTEIGATHLANTRLRKIEAPFDSFADEAALRLIYSMKSVSLKLRHRHRLTSNWLENVLKNCELRPSFSKPGALLKESASSLIEELTLSFPRYEEGTSFYGASSTKKSPLLLNNSFLEALSQLKNLIKLDIKAGYVPLPEGLWSKLPKRTKILSLSNLPYLPDHRKLSQLPEGLLDLSLSVSKQDTWSGGELEALPKGLRRVQLDGFCSSDIPDIAQHKLPPHLSTFIINGRPLANLPNHLQTVN